MWCIGAVDRAIPTTNVQLAGSVRSPVPAPGTCRLCGREEQTVVPRYACAVADETRRGRQAKHDYEYVRAGTCNLFVAVEPKGGRRTVEVTDHRAKIDFVAFIKHLLEHVYPTARRIHLVLDNLNTHFRVCFEEVLGVTVAQDLLRRVVFHYTPLHASWLNMAEIEIGILDRQCLDRRLPTRALLSCRGRRLGAAPQHRRPLHRVDLHATGCGSKDGPALCFVINGLGSASRRGNASLDPKVFNPRS